MDVWKIGVPLKRILLLLTVEILVSCFAKSAMSETPRTSDQMRAYAVFVVSFNPTTNEARGGVAGTAFFVSSTEALTAYHVLQPASFQPQPGFQTSQVWLVHESRDAIELHEKNLRFRPDQDLSFIQISAEVSVPKAFVFSTQFNKTESTSELRTEGYIASSTGPILNRVGDRLAIAAVPHLEKLMTSGQIVNRAQIDLRSVDVNLDKVNCLKLSYQPVRGLSGGPVLLGNRVIGVNSFADPESRKHTWAIAL